MVTIPDEGERIVADWGRHLETVHPMIWTIFFLGHIPECFLPHPKEVLEDAINTVARFYFDMGDRETSDMLKSTAGPLYLYCDEEEAVDHLFKVMTMPGLDAQKIMIDKLRQFRGERWS